MSKDGFTHIFGIRVRVKESQPAVDSSQDKFRNVFGIGLKIPDSQPTVHTNNCWGNIDYSPLAPTDKLNVKVSPSMAGVLTATAITAATNPVGACEFFAKAGTAAVVSDVVRGEPSLSVSITGYHGETFGHFEFPH